MCCFSGPVSGVSSTRIFARLMGGGRQALAYQMRYAAAAPVAMILPLPTPQGSAEGAVQWVNLKGMPDLFTKLEAGFPVMRSRGGPRPAAVEEQALAVVDVGDFVASFAPSRADLGRLDPVFRLPDGVLDALPLSAGGGFAVFQLKPGRGEPHPMAFTFPTSQPDRLFFPTLHVHDGAVHPTAEFNHELYAQRPVGAGPALAQWKETPGVASQFMDVGPAQGLVDGALHVYKRSLWGSLPNQDTWER